MINKVPPTIMINAVGLADAWSRAVSLVMKRGVIVETEYGAYSRDVCSVIEITEPYAEPMLHPQFPTKEKHMNEYLKQWERGYDWKKQGFDYNYMNRLVEYPGVNIDIMFMDQLGCISENISKGISRRLQAITWIPSRDLLVDSPPCLQRIWVRNLGKGNERNKGKERNVELHCMWRSRDCYNAWNSNMIGLLTMMEREMFEPNELTLVKVVDFCNSLHIYESDWEDALKVRRL